MQVGKCLGRPAEAACVGGAGAVGAETTKSGWAAQEEAVGYAGGAVQGAPPHRHHHPCVRRCTPAAAPHSSRPGSARTAAGVSQPMLTPRLGRADSRQALRCTLISRGCPSKSRGCRKAALCTFLMHHGLRPTQAAATADRPEPRGAIVRLGSPRQRRERPYTGWLRDRRLRWWLQACGAAGIAPEPQTHLLTQTPRCRGEGRPCSPPAAAAGSAQRHSRGPGPPLLTSLCAHLPVAIRIWFAGSHQTSVEMPDVSGSVEDFRV